MGSSLLSREMSNLWQYFRNVKQQEVKCHDLTRNISNFGNGYLAGFILSFDKLTNN